MGSMAATVEIGDHRLHQRINIILFQRHDGYILHTVPKIVPSVCGIPNDKKMEACRYLWFLCGRGTRLATVTVSALRAVEDMS